MELFSGGLRSSFAVLRPVPQPISVIVRVDGGELGVRRVKAVVRREGSRRSSMDWSMLPSVS